MKNKRLVPFVAAVAAVALAVLVNAPDRAGVRSVGSAETEAEAEPGDAGRLAAVDRGIAGLRPVRDRLEADIGRWSPEFRAWDDAHMIPLIVERGRILDRNPAWSPWKNPHPISGR